MTIKSLVSIVIPARESHKTILTTIKSIFSQTYLPLEIIIVASKGDPTKKVLKKYIRNKKIIYLEIDRNNHFTRDSHYKRWVGSKITKAKYIFYTDSKVALDKTALENALKMAKKFKAQAVAGIAQSWKKDAHLFVSKIQDKALIKNNPRFSEMEWLSKNNFGYKESLPVTTALMITRNSFNRISRDFALEFTKVASSYEDYVIAWLLVKNNIPILLTNKVISYHKHRTEFKEYFKQISRSGQGAALMVKYYPDCPFGKRRLIQVISYSLALFLTLIFLLFFLVIYGVHIIPSYLMTLIIVFFVLGLINFLLEKDLATLFIPPFTLLLITVFSYHFLKWYLQPLENNRLKFINYVQI